MRLEHLLSRALDVSLCRVNSCWFTVVGFIYQLKTINNQPKGTLRKEDKETFGFQYKDYITLAVNL